MRKKIFGIAALLAVIAMAFMFTTCGDLLGDKDDPNAVYEVTFINQSSARISVSCSVGTPSSFILEKAINANDNGQTKTVTSKGKKVKLTTIGIIDPVTPEGGWDIVELAPGSTAAAGKSGKDGLELIGGFLIFKAKQGNGLIDFKIDALDE